MYRWMSLRHRDSQDVGQAKGNSSIDSQKNSFADADDIQQPWSNNFEYNNLNDSTIPRNEVAPRRFPWEPIQTPSTTPFLSGTDKRPHEGNVPDGSNDRYNNGGILKGDEHSALIGIPDDAQEQLNFLASMTFANGGLRQPTCPCCQ